MIRRRLDGDPPTAFRELARRPLFDVPGSGYS